MLSDSLRKKKLDFVTDDEPLFNSSGANPVYK